MNTYLCTTHSLVTIFQSILICYLKKQNDFTELYLFLTQTVTIPLVTFR